MKTEIITKRLNDRRISLKSEFNRYEGYNHLCRTRWFNHEKKKAENYKKIAAINIAIKIILGEFITLKDVESIYLDCFPECDKTYEIESNFLKNSPELKHLAWVLENSISKYLPIFKKEAFKQPFYLNCGKNITNINSRLETYGQMVGFLNISFKGYLQKIKVFHHTFCKMDDYDKNMRPILLSCCGCFNLKANNLNFEKLLDAATLGVIHKDIQELINQSET